MLALGPLVAAHERAGVLGVCQGMACPLLSVAVVVDDVDGYRMSSQKLQPVISSPRAFASA